MDLDKLEKLTEELDYYFNKTREENNERGHYHVGILVKDNNVMIDIEYSILPRELADLPNFSIEESAIYSLYRSGYLINATYSEFLREQFQKFQLSMSNVIISYFPNIKGDITFTYSPTHIIITFSLE